MIQAKCDGGSGQGHSRGDGEQRVASKYIVKVDPERVLEAPCGECVRKCAVEDAVRSLGLGGRCNAERGSSFLDPDSLSSCELCY